MNIYQRLNEVRKAVSYARKDKRVEGSGYMAITHDAVTALVREHFVEHGIVVTVSLDKSAMIDSTTKTGKGIPIMRYEATYDVAFVNADEPSDRVVMRLESHALDQGDKAPGKAISYAVKYAMLKILSIETGEEDEGRVEQKAEKPKLASAKSIGQDAFDTLPPKRQSEIIDTAAAIATNIQEGRVYDAYELYTDIELHEEKAALWWHLSKENRKILTEQNAKAKEGQPV